MDRRSFLAALAAPLIAKPTLEEIERLGGRRRFFPGWSPTDQMISGCLPPYSLVFHPGVFVFLHEVPWIVGPTQEAQPLWTAARS
jgi:hypothetical protein